MKTSKLFFAVITAALIALFAACGDSDGSLLGGDNGADSGESGSLFTKTYAVSKSGATYSFTVNLGAAAAPARAVKTPDGPSVGDAYVLAVTNGGEVKTSKGVIIAVSGNVLDAQPILSGVPAFKVTVSGANITVISGSITFDDGTTMQGPGSLTSGGGGGGGGGGGTVISPANTTDNSNSSSGNNGNSFVPVSNITDVPSSGTANIPLTLRGTIAPSNATNKNIVWFVTDPGTTGAYIGGNTALYTSASGTVKITAVISNGLATGAYTKDFTLTIAASSNGNTGNNSDDFTHIGFYVDSDGNFSEEDSGRTVLVVDYKTEVIFYSDDIKSSDDQRVGLTFEDKTIVFFFEKDQDFPNRIVLSDSEGSYNGLFSPYDPDTQTFDLRIDKGGDAQIWLNIDLSKDVFTQYKDDLRMRNLYVATCIYMSLDGLFVSNDTIQDGTVHASSLWDPISNGVKKFFSNSSSDTKKALDYILLFGKFVYDVSPLSDVDIALDTAKELFKLLSRDFPPLFHSDPWEVILDKKFITLVVGDTETLFVTLDVPNTSKNELVWNGYDESIATVEKGILKGIVKAVAPGTTTIKVRALNNVHANDECTVTVVPINPIVNIATIQGLTPPVIGRTPVNAITENAQYSGTVAWNGSPSVFGASTVYTATITLKAKTGYTLQGVPANFFTVSGASSVSNSANSGVIRAVFPVTPYVTPTGIEMVWIPGGSFQMGDDREEYYAWPAHTVTLTGFYMGKYEVTQDQYQNVIGKNPSYLTSNPAKGEIQGNRPVEQVSWYDAIEFCNALSKKEGLSPYYSIDKVNQDPNNLGNYDMFKWTVTCNTSANGYRLPTEAQWEYAAKGGNGSPGNYMYSGSDNIDDVAWYNKNHGGRQTHEVGKKAPNALGLYDMSGNVMEYCWDWEGRYSSEAQIDPSGSAVGALRVIRGGSWAREDYSARSVSRLYGGPGSSDAIEIGFRVVRP